MSTQQWRPGRRVIICGGGPGAVSAGLAFLSRGFDVRIYEKQPECKAIGGAVLLSTPVIRENMSRLTSRTAREISAPNSLSTVDKGWHREILRSSAFRQMLELVPKGVIHTGHVFDSYTEMDDGVQARFTNGQSIEGDVLVGADGCRSSVSRQAFGDPRLFHTGIRLYLAWCDQITDAPPNYGTLYHDWRPSMKKWSLGRIVCLGDAVHPVLPYTAYRIGMATEDGYHLARALDGIDLRRFPDVTTEFEIYEC
ncbi:hypothetical protein D6D22_06880 [Aureobasidium pullulans]|uniref:FAD-binding domain-containing protein n=1 Tax=Aureobasidium pullulans TaxID=5580 RepID=A0A4S8XEB0_AURPU|nr:hypothetical protein D6D22_06880 [Aureobasidium pullulans]